MLGEEEADKCAIGYEKELSLQNCLTLYISVWISKGLGINNAILTFTESILIARNNKEQVVGLFLDLIKAFDIVNHNILIKKVENLGIRGLVGKWFTSFLSDRKQLVEFESVGQISHI